MKDRKQEIDMQDKTLWIMLAAFIIICTAALLLWPASAEFKPSPVKIPAQFSQMAVEGSRLFEDTCQRCHGKNGAGTDKGPPLVHLIYEPSHHGDASFRRAMSEGVKQHHWPYGNMPPIAGLTENGMGKIIRYVRELQRENGIQ